MTYELLYIIPAKFTDQENEGIISKISKVVEKAGAKITRNENLGKFKLAYPIQHARHGFYVLVEFGVESQAIKNIGRELRLLPDILRHQILSIKAKSSPRKEIKMVSYEAPTPGETPRPRASSRTRPKQEQRQAPKKKIDLEELDKKLDEILDKDIEI
ncbi:30S ribosomal protein S6 [Patescibacteria group bacterium]|nr:30S ribosomal protein S6 [Patescibacteria group bacterium]MBU1922526.1 30S ribosomal protein S6 [Patescibacteria group bacterium]